MRYEDASLSGSFQDQGPIARDDTEQLAAGERGPATGNVITGVGTQSGAAGVDDAAGAKVTALSGAGGNDSSADGGRFRVEGDHGTLSLSPRGDYSYNARAGVPENSRDVFTYTLSDASGATSQARLLIEIGKTPAVVRADAQRVVPGPDGVVVLPAGVELSDVRIVGRDLLIMLPDGSQMLVVDGAVFVPQLVINDIEVPSTNLAALLIDQEPRPASGVPQSSGGNFIEDVGPLDPGTPLGDLLPPTQVQYTPPEFTDLGLEEDREPETGPNALVQMDDDARPGGNAGGAGDDPDAVNVSGTLAGAGGDGPLSFAFTSAGAPAGFSYAVNAAGALVVSQGSTVVLTVSLNAQTGAYSVVQNAPIVHAPGDNENNLLLTFTYTVTDRDGDQATGTVQLNMDDDTPTIAVSAAAGEASIALVADDADTRGTATDTASSSANFGNIFSLAQSVGADGLGTPGALVYTLGTPGGASGLTQGGAAINLFLVGGKVVGSTATNVAAVTAANSVFDVSVGANGVVTLTQYSQIDHTNTDPTPGGSPFNDQVISLADGLVTLTASASISDRDGDSAQSSAAIQIGANLRFTDDGPSLSGAEGAAGVVLDETDARSGFPITQSSNGPVIAGAGVSFGADGQAAQGATTYAISIVGDGSTPLRTAAGDFPITLVQAAGNSNVITGTYNGGLVAFTLTINADGSLTVRQSVALEHGVDGSNMAAFDDSLSLSGLINAAVTVRDFDGDTASASAPIGNLVTFRDDGPDSSLLVDAARPSLVLDETQPAGSDTAGADAPGGLATVSAGFAGLFANAAYGADGAGSIAYSLVLNGSNVGSGLYALQVGDRSASDGDPLGRGEQILLNQSGNTITGSVGSQAFFTITINPQSGEISFTQLLPIWNPVGGASYDEAAVLSAAANALVLRQTVTDADGDSDSSDVDLGSGVFQIQDDGPRALADAGSLVSGSNAPATGNVLANDSQGRDGATVFLLDAQGQEVTSIAGVHGVLTLNANGDYSYVRNAGSPGGASDVFTYVLRDTDGDTATASLTIAIPNLTPTVRTPAIGTPGTVVNESALGERGEGESQGSSEQLAAGADGDKAEATSGTISFTQGDGPADIRINDVLVTAANQLIDTGEGTLRIDAINAGSISYTYTLKDNVVVSGASSTDVIPVSVTDKDGEVARTVLTITINNDRPDAIDDLDDLAAGSYGPATGNVLTGVDTVPGDTNGRDGVADVLGADGARVVAVSGVTADDSFDASGNLVVNGAHGVLTLKADGSYSYVRNAGAPGGVEDIFTYTLRDADGDQDTATLTIRIGNLPPTLARPAGATVYEAALGERGAGESLGSGEELTDGSDGDKREAVSGTINFTQGDGPAEISIAGTVVTGVNQLIDTGEGSIRIDAISAGSISYTYTLKDNVLVGGAASTDVVPVSIKDKDSQVASETLTITIRNDAPDAKDDVDLVGDALDPATGNLISGVDRPGGDTNSSDGTRDIQGADGAFVSLVASNNRESDAIAIAADGSTVIQGQYGVLTVNRDGSYSYLRNDASPLDADDVFTYTLSDNDGDSDTATLTIQIRDTGVVVNIPGPGGASTTVYENALAEREGEQAGSSEIADGNGLDNDDPAEAVSGTISFTAKDGIGSITVGTTILNLSQPFAPQTIVDDAGGRLVITSYSFNPASSQGSIGYTYTLKDNTSGDNTSASFAVVVKDVDGDQNGGNLVIAIRDDSPDAINDADSIAAGSYGPATGNVITGIDRQGGDGNLSDGVRDVQGADGAAIVAVRGVTADDQFDADGNLVVSGLYGVLSIKADGSYSYVRNAGTDGGVEDVFTYRLQDGDGDSDEATLTITIGNAGPQVDAPNADADGTIVFEKGLGLPATRQPGDSLGSGEEAAAGDNGDASEATSGTITYSSGDEPAVIRINDQVVSAVNQVIDTGIGLLTITSLTATTIGYTYVLKDNLLVSGVQSEDRISVSVSDKDGDTASDTLVMIIRDDAPQAVDDLDLVSSQSLVATGNVVTGIDRLTGNDANLADGNKDVQGADGAFVSQVSSNNLEGAAVTLAANGNTLIQGQYGILTISRDGSYSYTRTNGDPLNGDERFTYTLQDNDGDADTAELLIQIRDNGVDSNVPTSGAGTVVDEKGLPVRNGNEPAGTGEAASATIDDNSERTTGTITFTARDGWASISLGGLVITPTSTLPTSATAVDKGLLVINSVSFDPFTGAGSISYTYTLSDNTSGDNTSANLPLVITDVDGDFSARNLVIAIRDDAPIANDETDSVLNTTGPATGNLLTGIDRIGGDQNSQDGVADLPGADNASIVAITHPSGNVAVLDGETGALVINGAHGTLTVFANGDYSYTRSSATPLTADELFTYTLRDGDSDSDTAVLKIEIRDSGVTSFIPGAGDASTIVYEASLPARGTGPDTEPAGSNASDPGELVSGAITFTAPDGISELKLAGAALSLGMARTDVATSALGTLSVTSVTFNAGTGIYTVNYEYLLKDNSTTGLLPGGDASESFAFSLKDSDGDSSSGNLVITIVDDAPQAFADFDSVTEGGQTDGNVVLGTGAVPDTAAGKDVVGADGAVVVGVQKGDTGAAATSDLTVDIVGDYGTLRLNADGSYTYQADANKIPTGTFREDVFTYTIRDADGDLRFATLTIEVQDVTLQPDNQNGSVFEAALDLVRDTGRPAPAADDLAAGAVTGSDPTSGGETTSGDLQVTNAVSYTLVGATGDTLDSPLGRISLDQATGQWVYTLIRPASNTAGNPDSVSETFRYVAEDANGNLVEGRITILINDDKPEAANDVDRITEGNGNSTDGNVLLGTGASPDTADGKDVIGADLPGTVVGARAGTEAAGGSFIDVASGPAGQLIQGTYGNLLIRADGSYTYTLKTDSIPAGVTSESFSYRMTDGDGDPSVAQLTINFDQDARVPTVGNSTVTVFEDGLADGVQHGANSEFSPVGSFTVNFNGESGGKAFIGATELVTGAKIETAKGELTIGAITTAGNVTTYNYTYQLKVAQTHEGAGESSPANDVLDTFQVEARDPTGDVSAVNGVITIRIVDDIPVAEDDAFEILEGDSDNAVTFDVDTNDVNGADGFGDRTFVTLNGQYGTLTVNLDGTQTYTLSSSGILALNALGTGQTLKETFNYTLEDGDGDTDPAKVEVTLRGTDDPVLITNLTPKIEGGDAIVDEDDLPNGSDTSKESTTVSGDFTIFAPDGMGTLQVGSFNLFVNGQFVVNSGGTTPLGNTIRFTAYDSTTGKVSYTYTLNLAQAHDPVQGENAKFEDFAVTLIDRDGSTDTDTLSIQIVDDVVTAVDEPAVSVVEGAAAISGNVITDSELNGGQDITGADGATLIEVDFGSGFVALTTGTPVTGGYRFVNADGTYIINADGSWSFAPATNLANNSADYVAGFSYKLQDGDGDISTASQVINVKDGDGPGAGGNVALSLSEAALDTSASGDLAASTVTGSNPGSAAETQVVLQADGLHFSAGSDAITSVVFAADALASITVGGLQSGYSISWSIDNAGQLVGTLFNGATSLGTAILVRLTGETSGVAAGDTADIGVTATLVGALEHAYPQAAQGPVVITNIPVRASQLDGDNALGTIGITVADDTPSVTVSRTNAVESAIKLTTQDADTDGVPGQDSDTTSFAGLFTATFAGNADGVNSSSLTYSLGVVAGASGLTSGGQPVYLFKVGDTVVGSTSSTSPTPANTVFELSVSNATGTAGQVTLVQYQQIDHNPANPAEISLADNKVTLTATGNVVDGDFDPATDSKTVEIGANIVFQDDAPDINAALTGTRLVIDETDGVAAAGGEVDPIGGGNLGSVTLSAAALYTVTTVNSSADQPELTSYRLVVADGTDSGLLLSSTDAPIKLYNSTTDPTLVEGRVGSATGAIAFTVKVAADGSTTLTQFLAVEHGNNASNNEDSSALAANALRVEVTRSDFDGDSDSVLLDLGSIIRFQDDGPSVELVEGFNEPSVTVDETDFNVNGTGSFAGAFSALYGSDGPAITGALTYSLGVSAAGAVSGLTDSATGQGIFLFKDGANVVGKVGADAASALAGSTVAFVLSVSGSGVVTLDQSRAVIHSPDSGLDQPISLASDNLVTLTATATDSDNDTASNVIGIGSNLVFRDDAPTAAIVIGAGEVRHDETAGNQDNDVSGVSAPDFSWVSNAGDDLDVAGVGAIGFARGTFAIASTGSSFGADGAGSTSFSLLVNNANSGLKTTDGQDIFLVQVGERVEGRVGSAANGSTVAFALQVNASGQVEIAQYLSLRHPTGGTASPDETVYIANGALSAVVTVTDKDGDTNAKSSLLDGKIGFDDDGPTAVSPSAASLVNNAVGLATGTIDANGIADNVGADGGTAQFSSNLSLYPSGLTSGGAPITFAVSNNGQTLTATANNQTVFTATISGNSYTIDMNGSVDSVTNVQFTDANSDFIGGNNGWFGIVPNTQVSTPVDDNSNDVLITPLGSGTSVNTSNILGGVGAGQRVDAGEGFRLDYVVDLRGSPPNNYTQNAVNGQNFDSHWQTNGASVSFRQSEGTALRFQAFDDPDGNLIVGDGSQDTINGIVISYGVGSAAASSALLTPTATVQSVTVGGRTFTYYLEADGKSVIVTNIGGDPGNSGGPDTTVAVFTASGYNALEVEHSGGASIKFSGFGAAVPSTAPVNFNLPVVIVDGDGDISASANLAVTLTTATAPVALDLNGDGSISYLGREAGIAYDYNGDGAKEATAWVGGGDGILVRDQNANGKVDNAAEFVFGNGSVTDLAALRGQYGDVLDATDADFGKFAVWQDANGNAVADAGELKSLAALGISSIDLVGDGKLGSAANGDVIVAGSTGFVRNGGTQLAQDAIFRTGSIEAVRGSDAGMVTTASLVAAAAAAAALAAVPAAAQPDAAPGALREHGALAEVHLARAAGEAIDTVAGASSIVVGKPALDQAAPDAALSGPVQHHAGAQEVGLDSVEPVSTTSASEQLDQGTEVAAHTPAFFSGGGEISLPAPAEMAVLAAIGQADGQAQASATVAQVLSDALSGGGIEGANIDQLIDAAVSIARDVRSDNGAIGQAANDTGPALGEHLASPLAATVPGWDAGHFGPLSAGPAAAMEAHAFHPDAVQPVANG